MRTEETLTLDWFDDQFLKHSAFYADTENDLLILAKGGDYSTSEKNHSHKFFVKDFFEQKFTFYYPEVVIKTSLSHALEVTQSFSRKPEITESLNFDHLYQEDFDHFKTLTPKLQKAVLISREEFKTADTKKSLLHFFYSALNFGTGYPYGFFHDNRGMIGATPELLFTLKGRELFTFALAGTSNINAGDFLLTSTKDLHEHNLVVQDIEEKLGDYCSNIEIGQTHLHPFKNITHLRTDFKASINSQTKVLDLVNKMSPTAALGGYPMQESLDFLKSTNYAKKFNERIFGSSFGLISDDLVSVLVMIRNIQWMKDNFIIECGGGLVASSVLENELMEIELKRSVIKKNYL